MTTGGDSRHQETAPDRRCRLLITEDDTALRQMLGWEFEELGYRVIEAANCHDAMIAALAQRPHLALLDFNLPDGNGTLLLKTLRDLLPGLPVVIYSGRAAGAAASEACSSGAAQFLCKPVSAEHLHAIFSQLLSCETAQSPKSVNWNINPH
jgi:DNA-binding response OmpR family regulator